MTNLNNKICELSISELDTVSGGAGSLSDVMTYVSAYTRLLGRFQKRTSTSLTRAISRAARKVGTVSTAKRQFVLFGRLSWRPLSFQGVHIAPLPALSKFSGCERC